MKRNRRIVNADVVIGRKDITIITAEAGETVFTVWE